MDFFSYKLEQVYNLAANMTPVTTYAAYVDRWRLFLVKQPLVQVMEP
jgi:hypothetical protein